MNTREWPELKTELGLATPDVALRLVLQRRAQRGQKAAHLPQVVLDGLAFYRRDWQGSGVTWLNDFAPSFTVPPTGNSPATVF